MANNLQTGFLDDNFLTAFTFLEDQVKTSGGSYLCGAHLTGADIIMSYPLIAAKGRAGLTKEKYPKLCEYVDRLEKEPAYIKAVDKIVEIEGKYEVVPV